ncbi:hypothetical protein [Desulfovibrio sp. X2]|uniref:hypothetical protein n=1 Tax=Desulfovibrio sp. X2 TaxID=941449 RepID=UPI001268BC9E|nr:hypothetical protein [Desulfovibrio sp. X2]
MDEVVLVRTGRAAALAPAERGNGEIGSFGLFFPWWFPSVSFVSFHLPYGSRARRDDVGLSNSRKLRRDFRRLLEVAVYALRQGRKLRIWDWYLCVKESYVQILYTPWENKSQIDACMLDTINPSQRCPLIVRQKKSRYVDFKS